MTFDREAYLAERAADEARKRALREAEQRGEVDEAAVEEFIAPATGATPEQVRQAIAWLYDLIEHPQRERPVHNGAPVTTATLRAARERLLAQLLAGN